ncbi:hypothetical protein [Wenjunlia tyrosinilytica]|uniref:DUF8083 domain-containing protein n=1 Tax=Wenjunlia tyrosinilytica TaxID=1544741 RepID=A0A917ZK13_9ACTN|nr:hypothetical protein [Wenjunlia tyrosinilytica]GGO85101.1 hypothetical protein GCM10012280_18110 [Wenjunlia tyrosinilytica]
MAQSSIAVPYNAYLRVYEPLAAFPEPERSHWYGYATAADVPTAQDEMRQSLADLVPMPPMPVPVHESRDAFVAFVDGVTHICPWRTRLRSWLALEELKQQFSPPVLDAVLPPVVRVQVESDYERWRERNPDVRPWILSSTWHVPVRWFVLFGDEEREFQPGRLEAEEGTEESGKASENGKRRSGPVLRYRTPMVQARRRVARGLKVLKETMDEGPLIEGLVEVGRWLEDFHPRSLVELDYGGLVHAIPEDALERDRSAADVAEGLAALRESDGVRAGAAYERLTERWRTIRELQFAS